MEKAITEIIHCKHAKLIVSSLFPEAIAIEVYVSHHKNHYVYSLIARIGIVSPKAHDLRELEIEVDWCEEESKYVLRSARTVDSESWMHGSINLWDCAWKEEKDEVSF